MAHDIDTHLHQYNFLQNSQHNVTTNKDNNISDRLIFQFCITGVVIVLNGLILIPIIANRRRFWHSYLYCLLSTIISSILYAMIGMPVSILFRQERKIILYPGLLCKIWQITSQLFWDASIFSIFYMNLDLIIALMKPNIYFKKSYESFMKICLIFSWLCSAIENIVLASLCSESHSAFHPCQCVAKLEHVEVSLMLGLLLSLVTVGLSYVLSGDYAFPSPLMDDKLTCCSLPILLLDVFVIFFRVVPEVFLLILALKPGIFSSYIDEKMVSEELKFVTWTGLLFLPIFWTLDPTVRKTIKTAFCCQVTSREHQETHSPLQEE